MSADLLAEFGQPGPKNGSSGQQSSHFPKTSFFNDDIDFFGQSSNVQHSNRPNPSPRTASQSTAPAGSPQGISHQEVDLPMNPDSDVLFDAALDAPAMDEDDDWGEFEGPDSNTPDASTVTPLHQSRTATSTTLHSQRENTRVSATNDLLDLLSIEDSTPPMKQSSRIADKRQDLEAVNKQNQPTWDDDSFGDWGEFADSPATQPAPKVPTKKAKPPTNRAQQVPSKTAQPPSSKWDDDAFDDWSDFTDGPSVKTVPKTKPTSSPTKPSPAPSNFVSGAATPAATVRPTNIPPPSVLLELFLDVFEILHKHAAFAKAQLRSTGQAPSSCPKNVSTTALNIQNVLQSAARVIAGRSLRWKRDTILSQSMRIGPARSGKSGGMKLNSVNKQENIKEEQDAVDVLSTWRERAALFNAVLQAAGQRPIPTVQDPSALKVTTARPDQGAIKASHPCALCSLKRDERVLRVDEQDVQDSFGEWWTEHWGHTACREFWEKNRHMLGQR